MSKFHYFLKSQPRTIHELPKKNLLCGHSPWLKVCANSRQSMTCTRNKQGSGWQGIVHVSYTCNKNELPILSHFTRSWWRAGHYQMLESCIWNTRSTIHVRLLGWLAGQSGFFNHSAARVLAAVVQPISKRFVIMLVRWVCSAHLQWTEDESCSCLEYFSKNLVLNERVLG